MIRSLVWLGSVLSLEWTLQLYKRTGPTRFRQWVELEENKGQIIRAVEEGSPDFPKLLVSFLSTALNLSPEIFLHIPWQETAKAFYIVTIKNAPRISIPIVVESDNRKLEEEGWDYFGRSWHIYSHLFAKNYGWSLEYIANLKVEEAIAKIQEILTDNQLEKEFMWAMSEMAYSFDSGTKKTKFIPLNRPYWMHMKPLLPKKTKMLKALVPMGNVDYKAIGEEYAPKDIEHT